MTEKTTYPLPGGIFADIESLLCEVAQVFDGWHQDGTAWSEYDESVRKRCAELQAKLPGYSAGSAVMSSEQVLAYGNIEAVKWIFTDKVQPGYNFSNGEHGALVWIPSAKPQGLSADEVPGR
jgi:hypothetical protein